MESNDNFRALAENANDGIIVATGKGQHVYANKKASEITGFSIQELLEIRMQDLAHSEELKKLRKRLKKRLEGKLVPLVYETAILRKDGKKVPVEMTGAKTSWEGQPADIVIIRDIADRKQAEEALLPNEAQKKAILDGITINLAFVNKDLELLWANKAAADSVCKTPDAMIGRKCYELWADPLKPCEGCPTLKAFKTKKTEQSIMHTPDGKVWEEKGEPVFDGKGELIGVLEIAHDITAKAQVEKSLKESEEKYSKLFHSNPQWLHISTLEDGRYVEVNEAVKGITGYERDELIGRTSKELGLWADYEERSRLVKVAQEQGGFRDQEVTFIKKNGEPVSLLWSAATIEIMGTAYFINSVADITDHKRAEEALRESEEKYRNILENITEGYYETDLAGKFTFFNDAMCGIRGYSRDELMGMNNRGYMDPVTAKKVFEAYNQVYTTGRAIKGYEWETLRKDGTKGYVEVSASLMKNPEDKPIGFRGIVRDVTERKFAEEEKKRLEVQLEQANRMEAIATLAGGVAHEFNNALMGVMGNIELLKMDLPEDERRDRYFGAMKGSGHRMSRLTDQLLAYAQGGKYQPKNLKLDDFIIETLPILQHDISPTVRVETHFPRDIAYISADQAQMQMVLSAILANSNEAIEDEGLIRITAGNEDVDVDFAEQHAGLKPGYYVCLTIEDDGKGMDEETISGIFEPFFTTKFQGRGMGMAAVYGIVKNHDGWIYVDSELGKGTTVQIYLPVSEITVEEPKKAEVEVVRGSGTILMIEDEDVVIEVTQAMLEWLGYRVMVAKTGKDAIHITETFDGQIDLALLDIKLPDMEGGKVYPHIMEARPNLKVIVFSGYAIEGPAQKILDAGAQDFIQKPFSLATLSEKLKEVLGENNP